MNDLRRKEIGYQDSDKEYDCYFNDGFDCNFQAKDFSVMKHHLEEHYERRKKEEERRDKSRKAHERIAAAQRARQEEEAEAKKAEARKVAERERERAASGIVQIDELTHGDTRG